MRQGGESRELIILTAVRGEGETSSGTASLVCLFVVDQSAALRLSDNF